MFCSLESFHLSYGPRRTQASVQREKSSFDSFGGQSPRALCQVSIRSIVWAFWSIAHASYLALFALTALITLLASPTSNLFIPVFLLIGKVEANSYLAVLNSRIRLPDVADTSSDHDLQMFEGNSRGRFASSRLEHVEIGSMREVNVDDAHGVLKPPVLARE